MFEDRAAVGGYCDRSVGTAFAHHCLLFAIANGKLYETKSRAVGLNG